MTPEQNQILAEQLAKTSLVVLRAHSTFPLSAFCKNPRALQTALTTNFLTVIQATERAAQ